MRKSLYDISWQVPEEEYRQDHALSYSTLAKYEREGFNKLNSLFDRVETASLTFGSAVDSIITGGMKEFEERFLVCDLPDIPDSIITLIKSLYNLYGTTYNSLYDMPDKDIIELTEVNKYQLNWKPETRAKVIREKGAVYYNYLFLSNNKTILSSDEYVKVQLAVQALKESPSTKWYFEENNPFDDSIERLYQLKFKATLDQDINYRCMADLIIIDHKNKEIIPCDLKTSYKPEWDFYKSFIDWRYDIQAKLYYRIIKENIKKDPYFKDFTLKSYRFIVINKETLTPLVWEFPDTAQYYNLEFGKNKQIVLRDPEVIGKELTYYLNNSNRVPIGIELDKTNNINYWLNQL